MGNTTEKSSNFQELQERGVSAQQKRRKCRIFELLLVGDLSWILCGRGMLVVVCPTNCCPEKCRSLYMANILVYPNKRKKKNRCWKHGAHKENIMKCFKLFVTQWQDYRLSAPLIGKKYKKLFFYIFLRFCLLMKSDI